MACQRFVVAGLLHAVQAAADALLAAVGIREEIDVDIAPHTGIDLCGVDDALHVCIHNLGRVRRLARCCEDPHTLALLAEGHTVGRALTVAIVNADRNQRRAHTVPAFRNALLDCLLNRRVNGGLRRRVGLRNQDRNRELCLRLARLRHCLKQIAIGKTDIVDRNSHRKNSFQLSANAAAAAVYAGRLSLSKTAAGLPGSFITRSSACSLKSFAPSSFSSPATVTGSFV